MQIHRIVEVDTAQLAIKVAEDSHPISGDTKNRVIEEANPTRWRKIKEVMSRIFVEEEC